MYSFEEFSDAMVKAVAENSNYTVTQKRVDKLQGMSYSGMVCCEEETGFGVSLNLDAMYDEYKDGENFGTLLERTLSVVSESLEKRPEALLMNLNDYSVLKEHLRIFLVPVKGNEDMLLRVPFRQLDDLAAVYRFVITGEESTSSILVTLEMLETFGITKERLEEDALNVSQRDFPLVVRNLSEELFMQPAEKSPLWYVGTGSQEFGAGVIAYPGVMDRIAGILGRGYYLIPSSVHEILVTSDGETSAEKLDVIVKEVNRQEVQAEDRLSDHCYHYDPEKKCFESGAEYDRRCKPAVESFSV